MVVDVSARDVAIAALLAQSFRGGLPPRRLASSLALRPIHPWWSGSTFDSSAPKKELLCAPTLLSQLT